MANWDSEKISALSDDELSSLAANAVRLKNQTIIDLSKAETEKRDANRAPRRISRTLTTKKGKYVSEFHFVCPRELGTTRNSDGTFWSGTWVVAEDNARGAAKHASIVALHVSKSEHSYLQGMVLDWRKSPRDPHYNGELETKIDEGIDFLLRPTDRPVKWFGDGSGEKGYRWEFVPT